MTRRAVAGRWFTLIGTTVIAATAVPSPHPAAAFLKGSGELHGPRLGVAIETGHGGGSIAMDAGSSSLPRLVHYVSKPFPAAKVGDLAGLCNADPQSSADRPVVFGWLYEVIGYSSDNQVVSDTRVCVPHASPNDAASPSPTLPVAPTVGDVWRAVTLPRPVVGANPVSRGVTGLETRLWSGGAQTAQVAVTVGGFRVTGTAHVVEYRFATDEGWLGASSAPGDETSPAAAHRFAFKGAHSITVASVWHANVTMVGPGGAAPVPIDIDTAVLSATVAYPVVEVRSRLVG